MVPALLPAGPVLPPSPAVRPVLAGVVPAGRDSRRNQVEQPQVPGRQLAAGREQRVVARCSGLASASREPQVASLKVRAHGAKSLGQGR